MSDGTEKPIAFASRTLTAAERNYSQIEKEGLACVYGVKKFHAYLFGHPFVLYTDHKPLMHLFGAERAVPSQASARIQRWALTLAMYEYTMAFKPTTAHGNADALSRLPLPEQPKVTPLPSELVLLLDHLQESPTTVHHIRAWTQRDPLLSRVLQFIQSGWPDSCEDVELKPFWVRKMELSVQENCIMWGNRVVIPLPGRVSVLQELHDGHPGVSRMKRLARMFVWWPGLDQDIEEAVKSCDSCQSQRPTPPLAPLLPWKWPTRPWARVHLDLAGPFIGHNFLVLIDSHSKWMEVHPLSSTTSLAIIQCLRGIFAQLGLPEQIVTDNAPNLTSSEVEEFLRRNGIKHTLSPPYHPASNGLAERAVQIFKQGLKKMQEGTLSDRIARFLFTYRNTPQTTTGMSPAELLFGRRLRSRLDLLKPDLYKRVEREQERKKEAHERHSQDRSFQEGDEVNDRTYSHGTTKLDG